MGANAQGAPKKERGIRLPMAVAVATVLAAALLAPHVQAADYSWPVVRIVDGDTVKVDARADLPPELASLSVRLRGVDTPENGRRAKCDAERQAADASTAFTEAAIEKAADIVVRDTKWGKWGGRVIAELVPDGSSLSSALIETGNGRAYNGGRRGGWCETKPRNE